MGIDTRLFRRCLKMPKQVDEKYIFTVADSSPIDSFAIMVEEFGHNALTDFDGPTKVGSCSQRSTRSYFVSPVALMSWERDRCFMPPSNNLHAIRSSVSCGTYSRRLIHVPWNTAFASPLLRRVSEGLPL